MKIDIPYSFEAATDDDGKWCDNLAEILDFEFDVRNYSNCFSNI